MRILHLTPYYTPAYAFGGVVRSVEGMTRALARRGHEVTVLTTDALDQTNRYGGAADEVIEGVHVIRNRNLWPRGRANLSTPLSMWRTAKQLLPNVDVIHSHEFRTLENLLVTPTAYKLRKPLVLSPHGTLTYETGRGGLKTAWDKVLSPAVARRFDAVVGLTAAEVAETEGLWRMFGANAPFTVVPNGVDPQDYANLPGREAFRARYGLGDAPVCLFMGRLHMRKGVVTVVEAFKAANVPDARLVIVGPDEGMLDSVRTLADERIVITGYLGGADRLATLAAADMLALPAVGEGLPMVVLEAMAAGLPVIISPGCNLPDVTEFGAGVEVEAAVAPLAEALHQLLNDTATRQAMGWRAKALVQERFTWDGIAEQLEAVYERVKSAAF